MDLADYWFFFPLSSPIHQQSELSQSPPGSQIKNARQRQYLCLSYICLRRCYVLGDQAPERERHCHTEIPEPSKGMLLSLVPGRQFIEY